MRRHKIKCERPEPSASYSREEEEHDLAYYIHDRVELVHQVFSALKPKDLKAITPACIRHLSVDNIKELCTEELLGISSKRLCAILDGAEPPSDTESSASASPVQLETISLDSISSDEEILSQASKKSKKKHRHRDRAKKKKKSKSPAPKEAGDQTKASRAGLTVLELLELQARARAIRAQLQQEQAAKASTERPAQSSRSSSDDDEVLVKEEPPEVVEISSDDEKPDVTDKQNTSTETDKTDSSQKITKRVNNLVITVPQAKSTRKIKLNRTKSNSTTTVEKTTNAGNTDAKTASVEDNNDKSKTVDVKTKEKLKKKQKKKEREKKKGAGKDKDGSDHDEITLQLSDSEKLDLLEDLDRKNYDVVSSQSSEDSESSSSDSDDNNDNDEEGIKQEDKTESKQNGAVDEGKSPKESGSSDKGSENKEGVDEITDVESTKVSVEKDVVNDDVDKELETSKNVEQTSEESKSDEMEVEAEKVTEVVEIGDETPKVDQVVEEKGQEASNSDTVTKTSEEEGDNIVESVDSEIKEVSNVVNVENIIEDDVPSKSSKTSASNTDLGEKTDGHKRLSDGELSEHDSSGVEATEVQPEVVCISDEESKSDKKKKHKKKEKKNKKEKKSKKDKSDFRRGSDQNFYKDDSATVTTSVSVRDDNTAEPIVIDEDDIYEILELSDDSSCYEVEGTVLSKEPTAEEIEALSAKIDEIERVDVVTEEDIRVHERSLADKSDIGDLEQMSWKDRYLDSTKVKKVLTTSNILNALRKKNKELKKKIEESKTIEAVDKQEELPEPASPVEKNTEEGSIEQYNTLQGSTKYVDPIKEPEDTEGQNVDKEKETEEKEGVVTKEMKKDAKQLLKMYKRLLKYNDMNKQKDPNKKKKKKRKKSKDSENVASVVNNAV